MATIDTREDLNGTGNKYRKYKTEDEDRPTETRTDNKRTETRTDTRRTDNKTRQGLITDK
jgi:hypothetical protein